MAGRASDPDGLALEWDPTDQFPFRHIERCSKVWIARINGLCHAGGLVLTVHCDVTIASDRARFRAPELLRGIPDPFLTSRLPALVGMAKARYLLFSAREIERGRGRRHGPGRRGRPARRARRRGRRGDRPDRGAPARPPGPRSSGTSTSVCPLSDVQLFFRAIRSPEMVEGMAAFVEKRPPDWPRA